MKLSDSSFSVLPATADPSLAQAGSAGNALPTVTQRSGAFRLGLWLVQTLESLRAPETSLLCLPVEIVVLKVGIVTVSVVARAETVRVVGRRSLLSARAVLLSP